MDNYVFGSITIYALRLIYENDKIKIKNGWGLYETRLMRCISRLPRLTRNGSITIYALRLIYENDKIKIKNGWGLYETRLMRCISRLPRLTRNLRGRLRMSSSVVWLIDSNICGKPDFSVSIFTVMGIKCHSVEQNTSNSWCQCHSHVTLVWEKATRKYFPGPFGQIIGSTSGCMEHPVS